MKIGKSFSGFIVCLAGCLSLSAQQYTISTFAGGNSAGFTDGAAASAQFNNPHSVAWAGGKLYVADTVNQRIRVISGGQVSTFAGNGTLGYTGDGAAATAAQLYSPSGVAVDSQGNVYIADTGNSVVRKVSSGGTITTFAGNINSPQTDSGDGGQAALAGLNDPVGVAVDSQGNVYIADTGNNAIRKVVVSTGVITTIIGVTNTAGALNHPDAVAVDSAGHIYVCDTGNRRIALFSGGQLVTVAGIGTPGFSGDGKSAKLAQLNDPAGLAVDSAGNLYIGDTNNQRIREVNISTGIITTIAGNGTAGYSGDGGAATGAALQYPRGLAVDGAGNVYFADNNNNAIRLLAPVAAPSVTITSVSNAASGANGIVPNSWVSIFGSNFTPAGFTDTWANAITNGNLPQSLDGVSVSIGGQPAYIDYVSSGQINVVAPNVGAGSMQVTVTNNSGATSAPFTVTSLNAQPAFFPWPNNYAVATHADFTWAVPNGEFSGTTTVPAKPGEYIILWGTSFGPTSPATPVGLQLPTSPLYSTPSSTPVSVTIGGQNATVYQNSATLAPGFAALFQVIVQVPSGLANGDYPVVASINGAQSPSTTLLNVHN